ncbi:hypothetical protein J7M07_05385 [bacterium]|nr:hypothetical protein [bacterium]
MAWKNKGGLLIVVQTFFLFSLFVPLQCVCASSVDFLIPGISFGEIKFRVGSRAQYLVISEVYEVRDTSVVTLSVLDSREDNTELEISSSPWPKAPNELIIVRVIMSDGGWKLDSLENIRSVLKKVMIKEGENPFREVTGKEIENFELNKLFIQSAELQEKELSPVKLSTPAGEFRCELKEFSGKSEKKINLGGNEATRFEEKKNLLWISGKVPFWGLVQSEVRRKCYTKMDLYHVSERMLNSKETFLKAILISYTQPNE